MVGIMFSVSSLEVANACVKFSDLALFSDNEQIDETLSFMLFNEL